MTQPAKHDVPMQRAILPVAFLLLAFCASNAQIPRITGQPTPGDARLADYFRGEVMQLSSNCLANIQTLHDWESRRAEYRR